MRRIHLYIFIVIILILAGAITFVTTKYIELTNPTNDVDYAGRHHTPADNTDKLFVNE